VRAYQESSAPYSVIAAASRQLCCFSSRLWSVWKTSFSYFGIARFLGLCLDIDSWNICSVKIIVWSERNAVLFCSNIRKNILLDLFGKISAIKILTLSVFITIILYILRDDQFYLKVTVVLFTIIVSNLYIFSSIKYVRLVIWDNHTEISVLG